jgi:hypothetical protein
MNLNHVAAALAALMILPAVAQAQTTITACYVPKTGTVYRIKVEGSPAKCSPNHAEFSWTTSSSGGGMVFTKRLSDPMVVAPGQFGQILVSCEAGETVVGGGFHNEPNLLASVAASKPMYESEAWFVDVRNTGGIDFTLYGHAICAKPAS